MKTVYKSLSIFVTLAMLLGGIPASAYAGKAVNSDSGGGMPGYPIPAKPIPYTEVGKVSKAGGYQTSVNVEQPVLDPQTGKPTGETTVKDVTLSGVDALAADGNDPLAGNYTLRNRESILVGSLGATTANLATLNTYKTGTSNVPVTISDISSGGTSQSSVTDYDATSGDLNGDGQAEQIMAYTDSSGHISLKIGETPGTTRVTSAPAVALHTDDAMDALVRGYDDALWRAHYDGSSWGAWTNDGGGTLLSAPAVASKGDGTFDVFVLGTNNCTYQRSYNGSAWATDWTRVEAPELDCTPINWDGIGELPELSAPTAVASGSGIDLFRLGSDNTLLWNHSADGTAWGGWQSEGGMLATSPAVVSTGADQMQIFALGADGAMWFRVYNGGWGDWQRSVLSGVTDGVTFSYAPGAGSDLKVYLLGSDKQMWQSQCTSTGCDMWSASATPADDPLASGIAVGSGAWKFLGRAMSGKLMKSADGSTWTQFTSLPDTALNASINITTTVRRNSVAGDSIRIRAGHFLGDGREQLALAYWSAGTARVTVVIYKIDGAFTPTQLATYISTDNWDWMDMTTGDFVTTKTKPNSTTPVADGIDEIALGYSSLSGNNYGVALLQYSAGALQAKQSLEVGGGSDTGNLTITAGDLDGDTLAEPAIAWVEVSNDTYMNCPTWHFGFHLWVYDVSNGLWSGSISRYTLQNESTFYPGGDPGNTFWQYGLDYGGLGITLAAGDVNGDGKDEILRTWPTTDLPAKEGHMQGCYSWGWQAYPPILKRSAQAISLSVTPNNWENTSGEVASSHFTKTIISTKDFTNVAIKDRLAVGDLNRTGKNQVVWVTGDSTISAYYKTSSGYAAFATDLKPASSTNYPTLVLDNFTRENLRVGEPTHRLQNSIETTVAVINVPPRHQDLLKDAGGNYQLIKSPAAECTPSADDPGCTHAKFAKTFTSSSQEDVSTKRAFTVSAELEAQACAQGGSEDATSIKGCVDATIGATYGNNFENTETHIASTTFSSQVLASTDDQIVYYGTPMDMWEYPVLDNSGKAIVYMSVAFPHQVTKTSSPDSEVGYGRCDENWFHGEHQVNNVWSYDPITPEINFPDYDPDRVIDHSSHAHEASGSFLFSNYSENLQSQEISHGISGSLEVEVSGTAGEKDVAQVSGSIKASLSGDYTDTGLQTDKISTGQDTEFSYALYTQPSNTQFTTNVVMYWAKGGYQELNYQADPNPNQSGWNLYHAKTDPAFILPWYGFPAAPGDPSTYKDPPCSDQDQQLFSPDIMIQMQNLAGNWVPVTTARPGDQVRLYATVRDFSFVTANNVKVRFYLGKPSEGNIIGETVVSSIARIDGRKQTDAVDWTVSGSGDEKIYAVIDPDNAIAELHDAGDLIDNNVGYGLLKIEAFGYSEMGAAQQHPYDTISYQMPAGAAQMTVSFIMPRNSQTAVTRFELKDFGSSLAVAGRVFELIAYQGDGGWDTPISLNLQPNPNTAPSVLSLDYAGTTYSNPTLWRWSITAQAWEDATCAGYQLTSFPTDSVVVVPVCETGVYAFSESAPSGTPDNVAPTISAFSAASFSNSLDIPITSFVATDDIGIADYMITTSSTVPTAGDTGWSSSIPATYHVASNGNYTLYPWVMDAAGNISAVYGSPASVNVDLPPSVTGFAVTSPVNSLNIPITTFTATDNIGVTGYKITESATPPSAGAPNWTATIPTTYTVAGPGTYTLYPWAKDASDNVSAVFASPPVVVVDTTAPTITITNPDTSPAQSKTITASASDGTLTMSTTTGSTCDSSLGFIAYASQTFTSEADNGKKVCYKAVDAATNTAYSMSNAIAGIDTTAPTAVSSARANPNPTSATSVNFTVTFSESVSGVDTSDFTLTTSGVLAASVTGVSGSGATRTVSVNTGMGSGTIRLDVLNDSSIVDAASNPLSGGFTGGESYDVQKTWNVVTTIGGAPQGYYNLAPGVSTRASYAVNNGPVSVTSSTGTPIISSMRVAYNNGTTWTDFSEVMGLPANQATTAYWFPWYNNLDLNTQIRFANLSGAATNITVTIGGVAQAPIPLAVGQSTRVSYAINNGPVKVESSGGNIVASMRVAYNDGTAWTSFSEVMGLPANQATTAYWFPWYNNLDLNTQIRFANLSGAATTVTVTIGGVAQAPIPLAAGQSTRVSYAINNGPVKVQSSGGNIVASMRVAYKDGTVWTSFTEVLGLPANQATTSYWFPWYNNLDLNTQIRFANLSSSPATVTVTIGGIPQPPFPLAAGQSTRVSYAISNGPVKVQSVGGNIVASMRVAYNDGTAWTNFSEVMGMPANQLTTAYWFPWYNNLGLNTQVRFGMP